MDKQRLLNILAVIVVLLPALGFLMVGAQALADPQSIMDLVQTQLGSKDAASSIRGIYGGVGLVQAGLLIWLCWKRLREALVFSFLLCWGFAIPRVLSIMVDGWAGPFATNWLYIEGTLGALAILLYYLGAGHKARQVALV